MKKTIFRKGLIGLLGIVFFSSCSDEKKEAYFEFEYDHSKVKRYEKVLENLNRNGYVPYFRSFKRANVDFESWNLNSDESVFLSDSAFYYSSEETFYSQDKDFVYWLINFKSDTIVDTTTYSPKLWSPFLSPYASYISPCNGTNSNSRQALSLIYGLLNRALVCVTCKSFQDDCVPEKWKYVEAFLIENKTSDLKQLRKLWDAHRKEIPN
jgi:hypothetical protein